MTNSDEFEAHLVVPTGKPTFIPAKLSASPAVPPALSYMQQRAAFAAAAEADRAARFSQNWGSERTARLKQVAAQYQALQPGSKERQAFFADHHGDLFAARNL